MTTSSVTRTGGADIEDTWRDPVARVVLLLGGVALLVCGVVTAFKTDDGTSTAALVAGGFALMIVGYIGCTSRGYFREFEADLGRVRQKAKQTLDSLEEQHVRPSVHAGP